MGNVTQGTVVLGEIMSQDFFDRKDEVVDSYEAWKSNLDPTKPLDNAKLDFAEEHLEPIVDSLVSADGSGEVEYRLMKEPATPWNMIIGGQYQLNKSWQLRAERGITGNRKSFLLSVNYRFRI